jgi:hypothetical protein
MSYLWIKEDDFKAFKSFLSGNEIEVGLYVNPRNEDFGTGNEIEIFYGDETTDSYRAEIKRKQLAFTHHSGKSFVKLSVVKI